MSDSTSKPWSYQKLRDSLRKNIDGAFIAPYQDYQLGSQFQPIVSLTHARVIGHEGLMRVHDADAKAVAPHKLLHLIEHDHDQLMVLDRLARLVHLANAANVKEGWLFINMHPQVFAAARDTGPQGLLIDACREFSIDASHVVIEILEHAIHDESRFADAIALIREHNFLVALDDFGAGHSNFDRVWKLSPDIVKLDRVFATGAENDARIRRLLPRIVALLHESGVFVLLEGIETHTQAMVALDANIDFAQGDYFGRPDNTPRAIRSLVETAAQLWQNYDSEIVEQQRLTESTLLPYKLAMSRAANMLAERETLEDACRDFLALPNVEFCGLLDSGGRQIGNNLHDLVASKFTRFIPNSNLGGARWGRRPYFRSAIANIGTPQATDPYLSALTGHVCITVSLAFMSNQGVRVICGDIVWE